MAENRWTGAARAVAGVKAFVPKKVCVGDVWVLDGVLYSGTGGRSVQWEARSECPIELLENLEQQYRIETQTGGRRAVDSVVVGEHEGRPALIVTGLSDGSPVSAAMAVEGKTVEGVRVECLQEPRLAKQETWHFRGVGVRRAQFQQCYLKIGDKTVRLAAKSGGFVDDLRGAGVGAISFNKEKGEFTVKLLQPSDKVSAWTTEAGIASYDCTIRRVPVRYRRKLLFEDWVLGKDETFQFVVGSEESHLFKGNASINEVVAALNSIPGVGVETASPLVVLLDRNESVVLKQIDGEFCHEFCNPSDRTIGGYSLQRITIHGRPSGKISFDVGGEKVGSYDVDDLAIYTSVNAELIEKGLHVALDGCSAGWYEFIVPDGSPIVLPDLSGTEGMQFEAEKVVEAQEAQNGVYRVENLVDGTGAVNLQVTGLGLARQCAYPLKSFGLQVAFGMFMDADWFTVEGKEDGPFIVQLDQRVGRLEVVSSIDVLPQSEFVEVSVRRPTGPNWWTNPSNWSLGEVPQKDHTVVFEEGPACLYGVDGVRCAGVVLGAARLPSVRFENGPFYKFRSQSGTP